MSKRPQETVLERQYLPRLEVRSPATGGIVDDPQLIEDFQNDVFAASGVSTPTVVLVNLEGRFLTVSALYQLVVPLGQKVLAREYGDVSVVFATPDPATRESIRALAQTYQVPLFIAPGADRLSEAEPVGPMTQGELETMALMRRLGGRVTVAQVAEATGLDSPAAANRLNSVVGKHFAYRLDRPKSAGHLYIAPWVAEQEDAPDPQHDFDVPFGMRADVKALAALQGRAPDELVAEAVNTFIALHHDELKDDYAKMAQMMRTGDGEGIADYSKRFSKKKAQAHLRNRDSPK